MEELLKSDVIKEVINYDLFITKQANNGAILEYSLYEEKYSIDIDNLAHLTVTEDINYCDYKLVNGELVELTDEEKQALIPIPTPALEERNRADIDYLLMLMGE